MSPVIIGKIVLSAITPSSVRSISWVGATLALLGGAVALPACGSTEPRTYMGTGGKTSNGGANSNGGAPTNGGAPSGGSGQGGTPGAGGAGGGSSNTSGGSAQGGSTSGGSAHGGSTSGGSASGGSANGGSAASAGAGPGQGGSGTSGASSVDCPANATWCSSFEEGALPTGAVYKLNGDPATPWTHDFELDSSVSKIGRSSLRVKTNTEASGAYKMLAVPSGGASFWVRFYLRSDVDLGASDHNVYTQASGSDDPNDSSNVEFAEDVGLAFNSHDDVRWPSGFGRPTGGGTKPFTLPKDTWHCIEISFDGSGKHQQLFINGTQQIDATSFPATAYTFKIFKFGYNALHGTVRKLWYDAVAVAPTRVNCLSQ